jgi:proline iminopeptidase
MKPVIATLLLLLPPRLLAQSTSSTDAPGLRDGPHQAVINDVRLWYRVAGRAAPGVPPVVFLHGGPGQGSYHFAALVGPHLERSLRMVYFDQRGSGNSERPWTAEYAMATLVQDIEGLRRELGVPQIALIGHSFGGILALQYAATYPTRVSRLVIVSGMWSLPVQGRYQCERIRTVYAALAHAADSVATGPDDNCAWFWGLPAPQRDPLYRALMFPDSTVRARLDSTVAASGLRNTGELSAALSRAGYPQFTSFTKVTMPTLVMAGRLDGAIVPKGLEELTQRLPNATFVEYDRSGHFVYLDEPDRFVRDVTSFITARAAPKAR